MERAREEEDLLLSQSYMLIFDVYAGHSGKTLLDLLDRKCFIVVFVSTACTDLLQSHTLIPNHVYIDHSISTHLFPLLIHPFAMLELKFVSTQILTSRSSGYNIGYHVVCRRPPYRKMAA